MSLFPRFGFTQEFSPLFRLLDDYDRATRQSLNAWSKEIPTFQPKFDVKELKNSYELHGELPGIDQKDVSIEWVDGNTLAIKGRTEKTVERGTRPNAAGVIEEAPTASGAIQAAPGTDEHYHKPTVADEGDDGTLTGAGENTALTQATTKGGEMEKAASHEETPKYWVSERSVGEFSRSFTFPTRVDHDAVKASMKNGVLSIVVPKAQAPKSKKINIE